MYEFKSHLQQSRASQFNTFNFAAQPVTRQHGHLKVIDFDLTRSDGLRMWEPVTLDVELRPVLTDPIF